MAKQIRGLFREVNYLTNEDSATISELQLSILMEIADSLQVMSKDHDALIRERDWYKQRYENAIKAKAALEKRMISVRAVKTRYKNERDKLKQQLGAKLNDTKPLSKP